MIAFTFIVIFGAWLMTSIATRAHRISHEHICDGCGGMIPPNGADIVRFHSAHVFRYHTFECYKLGRPQDVRS